MSILDFIIGYLSGILATIITFVISSQGTLKIDHTDPTKDVYRMEIDSIDKLSKKKMIVLKVDNHADLSQK